MQKSLLLLIIMSLFTSTSIASPPTEESTLNYITEKVVMDFQTGVDFYNNHASRELPRITREKDGLNYLMKISNNKIRFTLIGYMKGEIKINGKLIKVEELKSNQKTSYFNFFINEAVADEILDTGSTLLLLKAVGELDKGLKDIGMLCFRTSCQNEERARNMVKIKASIKAKKADCEERQSDIQASIKSFNYQKHPIALLVTETTEFSSVKELLRNISTTNKKSLESFLDKKLAINSSHYKDCTRVMLIGSSLDSYLKATDRIIGNISRYHKNGMFNDKEQQDIDEAKATCVEMEELKSCLMNVQEQSNIVNDEKRKFKQPTDVFPDATKTIKAMER